MLQNTRHELCGLPSFLTRGIYGAFETFCGMCTAIGPSKEQCSSGYTYGKRMLLKRWLWGECRCNSPRSSAHRQHNAPRSPRLILRGPQLLGRRGFGTHFFRPFLRFAFQNCTKKRLPHSHVKPLGRQGSLTLRHTGTALWCHWDALPRGCCFLLRLGVTGNRRSLSTRQCAGAP